MYWFQWCLHFTVLREMLFQWSVPSFKGHPAAVVCWFQGPVAVAQFNFHNERQIWTLFASSNCAKSNASHNPRKCCSGILFVKCSTAKNCPKIPELRQTYVSDLFCVVPAAAWCASAVWRVNHKFKSLQFFVILETNLARLRCKPIQSKAS